MSGIGVFGLFSMGGCLNQSAGYRFREGGQLQTSRPLVEVDSDSVEGEHPRYAVLVDSEATAKRVNWEYLADEAPVYAGIFGDIDYERQFLAVTGLGLPRDLKIGTTMTTFEDGTMRQTHVVRPSRQPAANPLVHNVFERWSMNGDVPPEVIEIEVDRRDEPVGE